MGCVHAYTRKGTPEHALDKSDCMIIVLTWLSTLYDSRSEQILSKCKFNCTADTNGF